MMEPTSQTNAAAYLKAHPELGTGTFWRKKLEMGAIIGDITKDDNRSQQVIAAARTPADYDECILWQGGTSQIGYGLVWWQGTCRPAHMVVLELKLGRELAEGMETMHSCDIRQCINPNHLTEGSHSQNMKDAWARGRLPHLHDHQFKRRSIIKT